MRTLSTDFVAASQQLQTSEVFLTLLEVVIHENGGGTTLHHFVNNKQDITSNTVIYDKASFEIDLGGDTGDTTPQTTLRFDAGQRDIIRTLREVDARPEINLSIVLASNPDAVEIGPINYEVESFQIADTLVSMTLIVEPILNETIPSDTYTPTLSPGLWGNVTVSQI
jgi:hypothetical protein